MVMDVKLYVIHTYCESKALMMLTVKSQVAVEKRLLP